MTTTHHNNNTRIMATIKAVETIDCHEFSLGHQKYVRAIVPARALLDGRSMKFGLAPNLRLPNPQSKTVKGIVAAIESKETLHIDTPIKIACRSVNRGATGIQILLDDNDGAFDGGHRLFAISRAAKMGLDLSGTTAEIQLYPEMNQEAIRRQALVANTSTPVSMSAKRYASGEFDEIDALIDRQKYPFISWRDNEPREGGVVPTNAHCRGEHVLLLLALINFRKYGQGGVSASAHPSVFARGGALTAGAMGRFEDLIQLMPLFDDVFWMEKRTIENIMAYQYKGELGLIGRSFHRKTYLLDGSCYDARLHILVAAPVIYPCRVMIDPETMRWRLPFSLWGKQWVDYAMTVRNYKGRMKKLAQEGWSTHGIMANKETWSIADGWFASFAREKLPSLTNFANSPLFAK